MEQKTLYALIIAIDKYPVAGHQLNGCVNDASAFANYLHNFCAAANITFKEKRLFDEAANRMDIVAGFDHFQHAKDGDICVYYYSGHGSQMRVPESDRHLFWDEPDGLSETIVCYDSRLGKAGCRDMADKEIGYLIHKATADKQVHFLAVTDCCHSGSNTRDLDIKARMAETCPTSPRAAQDFIGFESWINAQPPAANHVHLAAAKDDETAKEIQYNGKARGVFTYSLIETLQKAAGNITYNELINRLQIKAKNKVKDQTPLVNFYGDDIKNLQQMTFLGESLRPLSIFPVLYSNENGWIVQAGEIQGVPRSGATFSLNNGLKVTTSEVFGNFSKLNGLNLMNSEASFDASFDEVPAEPLRLAFSDDSDTEGGDFVKNSFKNLGIKNLHLIDNQQDADYLIRAWDGAYRLTTTDDTKPLFRRVFDYNEFKAQDFLYRCSAVARWRTLLERTNPTTQLSDAAVEIQFRDGDNNPITDATPIFRQPKEGVSAKLQLGITNRHSEPLYVSAVFFGSDFSITNQLLQSKHIKKGETAWIEYKNSQSIPVSIPKAYRSWGVNEIEEYFKIFVSTTPLSTNSLSQEGLPLDDRAGAKRAFGDEEERGLGASDWRTFERAYRVVCPLDAVDIDATQTVGMGNIVLKASGNFTAKAALSSTAEAKRAVQGIDNQRFAQQQTGNDLQAAALADGISRSPELDVLELQNIQGTVSADNPLTIEMPKVGENEIVIAMGFDEESGLYIPLGGQDSNSSITIEYLPTETPTTRGFTTSAKIFFKKMIGKLTGEYDYPRLWQVTAMDETKEKPEERLTYETNLEVIKKAIADPSVKNIVLFVHGWVGSTAEKPCSIKRKINERGDSLDNQYDLILTYDYESMHTPIEENSKKLKEKLAAVGLTKGHGKQLDIIAHSMGGLVSRWFIERLDGKDVVSRLIMLGTPNSGSEIADLKASVLTAVTGALNGIAILQPYMFPLSLLGKGIKMMMATIDQQQPKGPFIQSLNSSPDTKIPYYIIAGNTKLMIQQQPELKNTFQKITNALQKRGVYMASDSYFGEDNDMIVRTESIKSPGLQTNVHTVDVGANHFNYFLPMSAGLKALNEAVKSETDVQGI